jgi:uncharacterized glyoxalase superfamily protein PhnB
VIKSIVQKGTQLVADIHYGATGEGLSHVRGRVDVADGATILTFTTSANNLAELKLVTERRLLGTLKLRPSAGGSLRASSREGQRLTKEGAMSTLAKNTRATVIPCLRYRDAPAAIKWLCSTFGFEEQLVVPNPDGTIAHAQLRFGNGMIMLGSVVDSEYGRLIKQPDEIGGVETQSAYVIVADADAIYQRAKSAGAKIVLDIKDEDYGGRGFTCRDLEGRLWTFGTYDPWS